MSFGRVQAPDYYYIYSHCLTPALCSCCFCSSMKSPGGHWVTPVRQRETPSASDRRSQSPVPLHTSTDRTFFSSKNIPTFPSNIISRPLIQSHFPPCVARRVDHFALPFASSLRTLQRLPAYPTAMMNALKSPKYHDLRDREAHPAESPEENNSLMTDHDGEVEKAWSDDTARDHPAMVSLRKSRRQKIKSAVMSFRSILDTVKKEGRDSLTAPEGKLVCDAYGIAVPKGIAAAKRSAPNARWCARSGASEKRTGRASE